MDLPPLTSSPTSSSPPQPSRKGDRLARRVRSKGQGSLCLYGGSEWLSRPRGRPHLYAFIGGSCLLRVLVVEFEGELCLHHFWRDALDQQRGPAQGLSRAPPPPQSEARPWGGQDGDCGGPCFQVIAARCLPKAAMITVTPATFRALIM